MSIYKGYTQSQNKATQKYQKENLDQIAIRVPKGKREEYRSYAASQGISLARLIQDLIEADMASKKEG